MQVEHPVTELVTGVDIVKEQIRIAAGERLSFKQSEITFTGHAIECRINAEDPDTFVPSPGVIHAFNVPGGPGVRVDTCAHTECTISPYYDSLVAKVIVHGRDRQEAIARMRRTPRDDGDRGHQHQHPPAPARSSPTRTSRPGASARLHGPLPRHRHAGRPAEGRRVILPGAHGHRGCGRHGRVRLDGAGRGARVPGRRRTLPSGARQARAGRRVPGMV